MFKKNPSKMITKAAGVVDSAVSAFTKAIAEIDKANEILIKSKEHSTKEIANLKEKLAVAEQTKVNAEVKINSHLELREKLSQFIQ